MNRDGFTIVEMIIAMLILTSAILGMGASASFTVQAASDAGVRSESLQAVEGQIAQIVADPRYSDLETLYAGTETDLPGLDQFERVTTISHTRVQPKENGPFTDYKTVVVTVSGPGLADGITRSTIVGAP